MLTGNHDNLLFRQFSSLGQKHFLISTLDVQGFGKRYFSFILHHFSPFFSIVYPISIKKVWENVLFLKKSCLLCNNVGLETLFHDPNNSEEYVESRQVECLSSSYPCGTAHRSLFAVLLPTVSELGSKASGCLRL
jgi:hypothetical protein